MFSVLLGLSTAALAEDWQNPQYIQQSFERIALSSEYTNHPPLLRKWRQPIIYQFQHDVADKQLHEQLSTLHLQQLSAITGHPIQAATSSHPANFKIIFTDEAHLAGHLSKAMRLDDTTVKHLSRNSVCIANFSVSNNGEIKQALVLIPVDRARAHAKLLACIVEELTQIMGLPNDDVAVFPSIFNDRSHDNFLSGLDYVLLKLLYQTDLTPGMDASQAGAAIERIMQKPVFKQWLQQADIEVRGSGLYPLLE
ncbi:MAG: DUF2927 domain-containing protein [Methylophaga sp.]|nr:DUF2927 domain-containing protein [Methylophaga sp.]